MGRRHPRRQVHMRVHLCNVEQVSLVHLSGALFQFAVDGHVQLVQIAEDVQLRVRNRPCGSVRRHPRHLVVVFHKFFQRNDIASYGERTSCGEDALRTLNDRGILQTRDW